jgi:FkbM family methyltransferase
VILRRLKAPVRRFLDRAGLDERFRDSRLYAGYLRLFFPRDASRKKRELNVYRGLISKGDDRPIFDIGANVGAKAVLFAKVAKTVVCVEPDRTSVEALRRRFRSNPNVRIVHAGVSHSSGTERLLQMDEGSPYNTFSRKWAELLNDRVPRQSAAAPLTTHTLDVATTTLDALIVEYGTPAYIKIDVEGSELNVIKGLSRPVPLLSFESILPEFREETLEILTRLHERDPQAVFNYCLDEPDPELSSERWLSYGEIADYVRQGQGLLMEIYCRQETASPTN